MYSAYKLNISLGASACKESAYNAQDPSSIPGLGRSPGEGNGNPLQYSCLENLMDRGAWWSTPHRLQKSDKLLNYKLGVLITIFLDLRSGYDSQGSGKCFPCCWKVKLMVTQSSCLTLQLHGLWPAKLLCPWNFSDKNTGAGSHSLLQGIFPTQGSNLGLLHCGKIL